MALRTPAFNDAKTYGFEWLRLILEAALQEGVLGAGDLKVTAAAAGAPLRVDVDLGIALVKGDSGTPGAGLSHGLFLVVNDAAIANAVSLTAAHATLPRIDQIVLRVRDTADLGSASDTAALEVVTGTATSGATLDNRTGAAALPNDAIRLADVLVAAASTAVVAGNVRDRRPWARGASVALITDGSTALSNATTTFATIFGAVRMECSGAALDVGFDGVALVSLAAGFGYAGLFVDSVEVERREITHGVATPARYNSSIMHALAPAAGSHLFEWKFAPNASSTMSIVNTAVVRARFTMREHIRQSAPSGLGVYGAANT